MAKKDIPEDEPVEGVVDEEHKRNLKVTAMMERGDHERLAREATAEKEVGDVREGQVYESLDPRDDDPRRRVRVMAEPDGDGQVVVENLSTRRTSHVSAERLAGGVDWRRSV